MINNYSGHYPFHSTSVATNAPANIGVYYCGYVDGNNLLVTFYVGRAIGDGVTIRSRLSDHLKDGWRDVTHFGYCLCLTKQEAETLEATEIKRLQPKYNTIGKTFGRW